MTTPGVWDPAQANFDMHRKASYSLFSDKTQQDRPLPSELSGDKHEKLWKMMQTYKPNDVASVQQDIVEQVEYALACTRFSFSQADAYRAAAYAVRDRLVESFNDTNEWYKEQDVKRAYYLSAEYLLGRAFQNALVNLDLEQPFKDALLDLGFEMEELFAFEPDPGLGNGGLGRLAACFLDSMATMSLPCTGYGIRYSYGIFKQCIVDGRQVERPDFWLSNAYPFEIARPDITYPVRFGGRVEDYTDENGVWRQRWVGGEIIQAMAYDNPIPGFDTYNTNNLRLWRACPAEEFDFDAFNESKYTEAVESRRRAEDLSAVLYPNDDKYEGKVLRLKQQYFFVSASLQDLLREFLRKPNRQWSELPDKVSVQMNDTHPTMAVVEIMRLLVDVQKLEWDQAWDLTRKTCNYTNHTVMPEALEKWPVEMMEEYLPRHLQIVGEINRRFMEQVNAKWGPGERMANLSLFQEEPFKGIRMGNIAVLGSKNINGVAAIHTEIVKKETFADFYQWFCANGEPNKFVNMTNGVTPRRWIHLANRPLSDIYTKHLGSQKWLTDMKLQKELVKKKNDPALQQEWMAAKRQAKVKLAAYLKKTMDVDVDVDALFDCQFKRIHEYKRQFLNAIYLIHRYLMIKRASPADRKNIQKRVSIIGGKAAPAYVNAKIIIKLINNIGKVIDKDPDVSPYLKVIFVPNYSVTVAQSVTPASDISEHISTAGTEASGTSNMKFVMNGGLIIGTMDGANIEIREEGGDDTMFTFGCLEDDVPVIKERAKNGHYPIDSRMQEVFDVIKRGDFSLGDDTAHADFCKLADKLCITTEAGTWNGDKYLLVHDFPSYVDAQARVDATYADKAKWCSLSIQAASCMAKFSTDRTMQEYSDVIWGVKPAPRQMPVPNAKYVPAQREKEEKEKEKEKEKLAKKAAEEESQKKAAELAAAKKTAKNTSKEKGKSAKDNEPKEKTAEDKEAERKAVMKKAFKEGGKRGVEIEGAADMGGLQFFCTSVETPDGDFEILEVCVNAMNAKSDPSEEERKGGSGHIGKMIFSAGTEQLAIAAYVPEEKLKDISCEEWLKVVLAEFNGEVKSASKTLCMGSVKADADKNVFPLKIREPLILAANNFLRQKGLFPEDNADSDEMVFGDDDFPS